MKKFVFIVIVVLFGCIPLVAFSGDSAPKSHKMMSKKMMGCCMMNKQMISTSDGLIVMTGNKLLKYDKDLILIKEVEIPMDTRCMEKMMQMKKECMSKDLMQEAPAKEESKETHH